MKNIPTNKKAFCVLFTMLSVHLAAAVEYELPYDSTEGLRVKKSYTGISINPYSHKTSGAEMKQLAGGLFFKLDLTPKPNFQLDWPRLHVRTVPGFQHYGSLIQGTWVGVSWTIRASYFDLGAIHPPDASNPKAIGTANNWASFAVGFDYTEGAAQKSKSITALALGDEEISEEKPEEPDPVFELVNSPSAKLAVVVSRLTPAILVSATAPSLTLFGGPQRNWRNTPGRGDWNWSITSEQKTPVYLAVRTETGIKLHDLSTPGGEPPDFYQAKEHWMLCWWGNANMLTTTTLPDPDAAGDGFLIPYRNRFQPADCPCLLIFQNEPLEAEPGSGGGLTIHFGGPAGRIVILPLLGDLFQNLTWNQGIPTEIIEKADWWAKRLCDYPYKVKETFAYDRQRDSVTVRDRFYYLGVKSGGTKAAPLPPALALAKRYGFNVEFSLPPEAPEIVLNTGPYICVDGEVAAYSVPGLPNFGAIFQKPQEKRTFCLEM